MSAGKKTSQQKRDSDQKRDGPRSLLRVLMILKLLADSKKDLTLTEVSETAGWPKSSIMVLMRALVSIGYLERVEDRYRLGWAAYDLANRISARRELSALVRPHMFKLARASGQTVLLSEMSADQKSVVHREVLQSDRPIRYVTLIGETRPLYTTANGTCLVSFMPIEWINEYLRKTKFVKFTKNTVVSRSELRSKFLTTRERGYAISLGEYNEAVGGIAAPIFTHDGTVAAALGVAGPVEAIKSNILDIAKMVAESAHMLSTSLGHS